MKIASKMLTVLGVICPPYMSFLRKALRRGFRDGSVPWGLIQVCVIFLRLRGEETELSSV